jgi:hypothetical protein
MLFNFFVVCIKRYMKDLKLIIYLSEKDCITPIR